MKLLAIKALKCLECLLSYSFTRLLSLVNRFIAFVLQGSITLGHSLIHCRKLRSSTLDGFVVYIVAIQKMTQDNAHDVIQPLSANYFIPVHTERITFNNTGIRF